MPRKLKVLASQVGLLAFILLSWQVAAARGWLELLIFSSPLAIGARVVSWFSTAEIWRDLGITVVEGAGSLTIKRLHLGRMGSIYGGADAADLL
jgi:ABC-type nitrate/sulfonate/bicarbonate transport system permease component